MHASVSPMNSFFRLSCAALLVCSAAHAEESATPPAKVFNLSAWKLQIPGPKEFKDLSHYSSEYFHLNARREMCFHLDAAEKGHTPNTKFVRSELRHNVDWKVSERHSLEGEFRVESHLNPDKITLMQIHGITDEGENAPPFLRIAVNQGNLYAMLKPTISGDKTESVPLKRDVKSSWVKVGITVAGSQLVITVDGKEKLRRDVAYWKYSNYFKAGLYPQATSGTVDAYFRELKVE